MPLYSHDLPIYTSLTGLRGAELAPASAAGSSSAATTSSLGLKKFVRSGAVSPAPPSLVNTGGRGGLRSTSNISFKVRSATPTTVD